MTAADNPNITRISDARALITAGWDDVPHLTETKKAQLLASTPPHMRDARSKGIPSLGAGAIYPIPENEITCDPFPIPAHYQRCFALDVGWNNTATIWVARDPSDGCFYAYSEYKRGKELPVVHTTAIQARGKWIKGCVDPAARGRAQADGKKLINMYRGAGLDLAIADNSVDAGIHYVYTLLATGQLKIFSTLTHFFQEYRLYRRERKINEFGVERYIIVKKHDHLMDCLRYAIMTFENIATAKPAQAITQTQTGPSDNLAGY